MGGKDAAAQKSGTEYSVRNPLHLHTRQPSRFLDGASPASQGKSISTLSRFSMSEFCFSKLLCIVFTALLGLGCSGSTAILSSVVPIATALPTNMARIDT